MRIVQTTIITLAAAAALLGGMAQAFTAFGASATKYHNTPVHVQATKYHNTPVHV